MQSVRLGSTRMTGDDRAERIADRWSSWLQCACRTGACSSLRRLVDVIEMRMAVAVALLLCGTLACAQAISFQPPQTYPVGTFPNAIATGDFNADGIPDFAVANAFSANVSILIGHADGTWAMGTSVGVGGTPAAVAVGDFNGDGQLDLAICDVTGGTVIIYTGTGTGTFKRGGSYGSGQYPTSIAVADVNRDGKPDLVIANGTGATTGQTVSVLLGNGDGSFRTAVAYFTGASPSAVAVADFNADGKPDLAVTNGVANTVSILLGNGDGTFGTAVNYATGAYPDGLAAADLNGDGKIDLVVVNDYSSNASVLLGRGDGTFTAATYFATGYGSAGVAIADLDGDGRADLAVVNRFDNTLTLLLGNGNGTFRPPLAYSIGGQASAVIARDLDGDGRVDVLVVSAATNSVSVLRQVSVPPASLAVQSGSPQSAALGSVYATPLAAIVRDVASHPLQGVPITFAAPGAGTSGLFAGGTAQAQVVSNAAGVAIAPAFTANTVAGLFNVVASVGALSATFALTNTTQGQAPVFTSAPPPGGTFNAAYNFAVTASGTPAPTFSAVPDSLPTGLTLDGASGRISGTPSATGAFAGLLTAVNGNPPNATQNFAITISAAGQSITFGSIADHALGTGSIALAATASSGLPVGFASSTPSTCTVTGTTVTLAAAGTCTIQASQPGNAIYSAASSVSQTFTISAANNAPSITLVSPADAGRYVAPAVLPLYAIASDRDGTVARVEFYNGGTLLRSVAHPPYTYTWTGVAAGTYALSAKAYDNQGASVASPVATITVAAATQSVSFVHSGDFSAAAGGESGTSAFALASGDFDANQKLDLAAAATGTRIGLLAGDGSGNLTLAPTLSLTGCSGSASSVLVVDLDGDSTPDLVTADASGCLSVQRGTGAPSIGTASFGAATTYALGARARALAYGDFDGDGHVDIVAALANGAVSLLRGRGDGTFQSPVSTTIGASLNGVAVSDFNNDHKLDLVVADSAGHVAFVLLGNGDGTFQSPQRTIAGAFPDSPYKIVAADFNGDGNVDIAYTNDFANSVSVLLGGGDGTFQPPFDYPVGNTPEGIVVADFNGDHKLDLAIANSGDNTVSVLVGNGNGSFQAPVNIGTGASSSDIVLGDFNGDGLLDLVVNHPLSPVVSVIVNTTSAGQRAPVFTSGPPPDGTAYVPYHFTFTATGPPAPHFTLATTSFLNNEFVVSSSGVLTGSPSPGLHTGVVVASNGVAPDATQSFSLVVPRLTQTISFASLPDVRLFDQAPTIDVHASSGLGVALYSLTADVCSVRFATFGQVWVFESIAVGTCVVRAEQPGDESYEAAAPVERSFQVLQRISSGGAAVLITSPTDHQGLVAPGSLTITASAQWLGPRAALPGIPPPAPTDPLFVDFYVDGVGIASVATSPPSNAGIASVVWDQSRASYGPGPHIVTARLRELTPGLPQGSWYTDSQAAAPVTFIVTAQPDTPTVTLTAPASDSSYTVPATINFAATATNSPGSVSRVDFYDGPLLVGSATQPPYSFAWTSPRPGRHTLSAKAISGNGVAGTSGTITINIATGIDTPIALFDFDDAWEVSKLAKEPLGNNYGEVHGAVVPVVATAIQRKPDTCRAARFGGGTIDAGTIPVPLVPDGITTVAFWMNWNGADGAMPLSWDTEGLILSSGGFGFSTTGTDVYGIASATLSSGWHHVIAEFHNGGVAFNRLLIDGVAQTLSQRQGTPTPANANVSYTLRLGGQAGSLNYRFTGAIDDVQVFDGPVSAARTAEIVAASSPCSTVSARLLAPTDNSGAFSPATIEFVGVASTANSSLTALDLYDGTTLLKHQPVASSNSVLRYTAADVTAGVHSYALKATDSAGLSATSSPVSVTVTAFQIVGGPTTTVTVPSAGATLYIGDPIHLAATVDPGIDNSGVYGVYFYVGGQLVGSTATAPYNFTYRFPSPGTFTIVSKVIDNLGNVTNSAPITITVVASAPQVVYYYNDVAGTPVAATDQNGTLLWRETYEPFGARYSREDTGTNNGLWYTGKPTEDATGLSYYGARWYNPTIGRFYSADPKRFDEGNALSFNRYAYANNNPYRYVDPSGGEGAEIVSSSFLRAAIPGQVAWDYARTAWGNGNFGLAAVWGTAMLEEQILYVGTLGLSHTSMIARVSFRPTIAASSGEKVIVIGEDMEGRVIPTANARGAEWYKPEKSGPENWMKNNIRWINQKMDEGCKILDCGAAPGRANYPQATSPYYREELNQIKSRGYVDHKQITAVGE